MKIFKYVLPSLNFDQVQRIPIQLDAQILSAQYQEYTGVVIWALVDEEKKLIPRDFVLYPTGAEILDSTNYSYLATIQRSPSYVLHLFEIV